MILIDPTYRPRLRPVEAFRIPDGNGAPIGLRDRSGFSAAVLSVSEAALLLISLMDGSNTVAQIREAFARATAVDVPDEKIWSLVEQLDRVLFLDSGAFEGHYERLLREYRERGARAMPHAAELGIDGGGVVFEEMLRGVGAPIVAGQLRGLIVPHLDYPRGRPCYAAGYSVLKGRDAPQRVVILGTNHFGRSMGVVATGCAFETPLGTTRTDVGFLERLEAQCGSLRAFELDHAREHSVELQVAWLQYLFGANAFEIVAFLCQDACGMAEGGSDVDASAESSGALKSFAVALRDALAEDNRETLVIAGADFSHVGTEFGEDPPLETSFLESVARRDREALEWLQLGQPEKFIQCVAADENSTRICSTGCMYALSVALAGADATPLGYHQAVDIETQTCVTCAAMAFCTPS